MSFANLLKKGSLRGFATATPATPATVSPNISPSVATVATVAVASAPENAANEPTNWHSLDTAYLKHHFACRTCIAAGRGIRHCLRCGVGAALWRAYSEGQ